MNLKSSWIPEPPDLNRWEVRITKYNPEGGARECEKWSWNELSKWSLDRKDLNLCVRLYEYRKDIRHVKVSDSPVKMETWRFIAVKNQPTK